MSKIPFHEVFALALAAQKGKAMVTADGYHIALVKINAENPENLVISLCTSVNSAPWVKIRSDDDLYQDRHGNLRIRRTTYKIRFFKAFSWS